MRTFIAIDIPSSQPLQSLYSDLTSNLAGLHVKYTDIQSMHLTLAFLGETSEVQSKALINHLNNLKSEHTPFDIELNGLGQFAKNNSPQVIWVGIKASEPLTLLWNQVNSCIKLENFEPDQRGFSPHLTIGRVKFSKPRNNIDLFIKKYQNFNFGNVIVEKFVFYQSILQSSGPVYKTISNFSI
jgi:RNA 2',3'-cyclic 3'-phosphodiesterase